MRPLFACAACVLQSFCHGMAGIKPLNVAARDHERGEVAVVQAKNVLHHLVFVVLNDARVAPLGQAGADFFLCHRTASVVVHPQQFEHPLGGEGEQAHKGPRHARHPGHGAGHQAGDGFGIQLANALGHQLAKHDGDEGDDGDHHRRGRDAGRAIGQAPTHQRVRQRIAEGGFAQNAVDHADRRDAHLHGREKLRRVLKKHQRRLGGFVSGLRHGHELGLSARCKRQFRHGKSAVKQR